MPRPKNMTLEERQEWRAKQPTAVYRLYDAAGVLLYVGITYDVEERWRDHRKHKVWWPQVVDKKLVWYDNRAGAEAAEVHTIVTEGPLHNKNANWPSFKAEYRIRWLQQQLEAARKELCTPRKPRSKAGRAALVALDAKLGMLDPHTPSIYVPWDDQDGGSTARWEPQWAYLGGLCAHRVWPARFLVLATRYERGDCPECGVPVPCPVVKGLGEPFRDHPFYCL